VRHTVRELDRELAAKPPSAAAWRSPSRRGRHIRRGRKPPSSPELPARKSKPELGHGLPRARIRPAMTSAARRSGEGEGEPVHGGSRRIEEGGERKEGVRPCGEEEGGEREWRVEREDGWCKKIEGE